jgi:putative NADPH-quinone reductase
MRILVLYAHPLETSFHAALHARITAVLREQGHEVDDCDLYAEGFDPVLSRQERFVYQDTACNTAGVADYVQRLQRAEALVLCFPVWSFGLPAILKGFFDRVLLPGVAFDISDPAHVRPALTNLRHIIAVATYGQPRWMAWWMGDPPRKLATRYLRSLCGRQVRISYHAHYHMNVATRKKLSCFMDKVAKSLRRLPMP